MNAADRSPAGVITAPPHREVTHLLDAFDHRLARSRPHLSPDRGKWLQPRTNGAKNTLDVSRDQILLAHFDHGRFSSLACRYISDARSGSFLRSNSFPSVW